MYKGFNDFTTSGDANEEGLFYDTVTDNVQFQQKKIKALSRTYVQAYQGKPSKVWFNRKNSDFISEYQVDVSIKQGSMVYLSEEYYYPNGYVASVYIADDIIKGYSVKVSMNKVEDNYLNVKIDADEKRNTSFVSVLYITQPISRVNIEELNTQYLSKIKVGLEVKELEKNQSAYASIEIKQVEGGVDYYLVVVQKEDEKETVVCEMSFKPLGNGEDNKC